MREIQCKEYSISEVERATEQGQESSLSGKRRFQLHNQSELNFVKNFNELEAEFFPELPDEKPNWPELYLGLERP